MIEQLNNFKCNDFENYLKDCNPSDDEIKEILKKTLSRPEILSIHSKSNRKERDKFLASLCNILDSRGDSVKEIIINKGKLVQISEELFDNISNVIEECEISKLEQATQIWAHLTRVESTISTIYSDIEKSYQQKPKTLLVTPFIRIKTKEGVEYSPDAAIERQVSYLSLTLSLLSYKNNWFKDGKVVLPNRVIPSEEDLFKAGSIELLALSWKQLEDNALRSILFGGDIFRDFGDDVPSDAREHGVKTAYYFSRSESEFEMFDSIACERFRKRSLQNFMEIMSHKGIKPTISNDLISVGKLSERSFISEDEIHACGNLQDVFCTNVFEDDTDYNGLTLRDWIRGYFTLRYLSDQVMSGEKLPIFSFSDMLKSLLDSGLTEVNALTFIELASFGKNSRDLFDCPLIKLEDSNLYLAYHCTVNSSVPNLILSRFSSLESESGKKGYRFEKEVIEVFTKHLSPCKSFKFKRELEEYEYDCVFVLDKRIFVFECKNRSLSWSSAVKAYRTKEYLSKTVKQVNRLKDALIEYPEVIREHFGVDVNSYEVIPVIFNCMPFSWLGKFDDVYISDFSSLSRFAKSSKINIIMTSKDGQVKQSSSKSKQWTGSTPNSDDLIRHLENPIQLRPFLNSRKKVEQWWIANTEVAFVSTDYEVDSEKYKKAEKAMFSPPAPIRNEANKRAKVKRNMIKSSKRKNRNKK
ncbi:NERD domain-containing protein [Shewanella corallii]|uniref:NERD domain-containing protein n=1 Tax=Shewanella corallii TaxID=560080 RepID=A0ABT0N871_9GAMM|nr:NERD domain-containing protein [Shewanella corallii]MCL2914290.1 NERD domain-containing protein [Shewanella corallii]